MPKTKPGTEFLVANIKESIKNIVGAEVDTSYLPLPPAKTFPYEIGTIAAKTNIIRMTIPADLLKKGNL